MRQPSRGSLAQAKIAALLTETENKSTCACQSFIGLLVISDDPALSQSLGPKLQRLLLDPRWATSLDDALDGRHGNWTPEAVLIDLLVPRSERYSICREARAALGLPVILVDQRPSDPGSLNLGADLYLEKPMTAESIWAGVRAVKSRSLSPDGGTATGELLLFSETKSAFLDGRLLDLDCDEFALLTRLADAQGSCVSRGELVRALHAESLALDPRLIDVHIVRLMVKLAARSSRRIVRSTSSDAYMLSAAAK